MPTGLKNQIQKELANLDISSVYPKTFYTLTENSYAYGSGDQSYVSEVITAFAKTFGRPKLKIKINLGTKTIEAVEIDRGAPCGSTHHVAAGTCWGSRPMRQ